MVDSRPCAECAHRTTGFCVAVQQLMGLIAGVFVISVSSISNPCLVIVKLMPTRYSSDLDKYSPSSIFTIVEDARVAHKNVMMCGNNNVQQYELQYGEGLNILPG